MKAVKTFVICTFFTSCCLFVPVISKAQGQGGGGDPDTPIDGGITLLLAAGAAYGVRRIGKRKENQH